jgi:hypothetical protein
MLKEVRIAGRRFGDNLGFDCVASEEIARPNEAVLAR